jgi:transposase InsO family protein
LAARLVRAKRKPMWPSTMPPARLTPRCCPKRSKAPTAGFLNQAVAWFGRQGIECRRVVSDNGSAYRSKPWRHACEALGLPAKRTRPYTPRTNGKAERFIKTLVHEWA